MKERSVKLSYPFKKKPSEVNMSISIVPFSKDMTIYDTVDIFKKTIFTNSSKIKLYHKRITNRILLRNIINLHNVNGIRDVFQINTMIPKIKSGKSIFNCEGLPNVKLVKTKNEEWVLFDGHHSMLAYMISDRRYLDEIPHLVVEDKEKGFVTDKEISVFFGEHSTKLRDKNWRKYVINWQAPKENQFQRRIQKNMGELVDLLISKFA